MQGAKEIKRFFHHLLLKWPQFFYCNKKHFETL